jgi:hypothetical protein
MRYSTSPVAIEPDEEAVLRILDGAGGWLTSQQVSDRCDDPFVAARARDLLAAAAAAGLVHVRRLPDDAAPEWRLSSRGRRALRRSARHARRASPEP